MDENNTKSAGSSINFKNLIQKALSNNGQGWTVGKIIKTTVLVVVALLALSIVLAMFKWVFGIGGDSYGYNNGMGLKQMFEEPEMMLDYADEMMGGGFDKEFDNDFGGGIASIKVKARSMGKRMMAPMNNIAISESMPYPMPSEPASKDAEDFETREYSARYERRNINKVCNEFENLKPLDYVVFENATQNDEYCNYRFKVEQGRENEIITMIKALEPKDFDAHTFTLERNITNNNNEVAILEKKKAMLDDLLKNAQAKYAKLQNTSNTNALVQAINNEINLIERITNQKLNVQSRIDRLTNSTGVQKERIDYSQFNISVSERKFINWDNIGEQWKYAFERFISGISKIVQELTIGLVVFVLGLVKFIVFLSVGIVAIVATAKFLWNIARKIWRG